MAHNIINLRDPVEDVMRSPVVTVDRMATVRQAARLLHDASIGTLVVLDGPTIVGIMSERDVVGAMAADADPDTVRVGDVMSKEPRYLTCGEPVASALEAMLSVGVRHLPVLAGGEPVGIVSMRDVVAALGTKSQPERAAPR